MKFDEKLRCDAESVRISIADSIFEASELLHPCTHVPIWWQQNSPFLLVIHDSFNDEYRWMSSANFQVNNFWGTFGDVQ